MVQTNSTNDRKPKPAPMSEGGGGDGLLFIEPDGSNREEARRLGYRFVDLIVDAAAESNARPPFDRGAEGDSAPYSPSPGGRSVAVLLEEVGTILRSGMNPAHPGYLGHMDSLSSAIGIFSDAVVSALNNNMLAWEMSPIFTEMEQRVMRWFASLFGLDRPRPGKGEPAGGATQPMGTLVSGGTLANITALLVARNAWMERTGIDGGLAGAHRPPVFLASENAHFSFQKAANLLGLGRHGWVRVPSDENGRVRLDALEETLARVRAEGCDPFCLVGIAGTTVTGSIDPLKELAAVAHREGLWFHVDAAYGGAIALSDTLRPRLDGIESADSVTFNPQKWLFVPKTCASVLFRDSEELNRHLREEFVYGTSNRSADGRTLRNLGEWTLQGTRRVDVLKLYLTFEQFGRDRLAGLVERQVELARLFASAVGSCPELELLTEPDLNIVCFRYRGAPHWPEWVEDDSPLDRLNARIQEKVEQGGFAWLSLPRYKKRSVLRAVVIHPRCDEVLLDRLLDLIRDAGRELTQA